MRLLLISVFAVVPAIAQLTLPRQPIRFPANSCNLTDPDETVQTTIRIASTAGTLQFQTFADPARWLRVEPLLGTVSTAGIDLKLSVDKSKAGKGSQETWFTVGTGNTFWVLFAGVDCTPSPTLKIPEESLEFTATEGDRTSEAQFTVQHNNQTPGQIDFTIGAETPFYAPSWIVRVAQPGLPLGQGTLDENNPARVTVRVDPRNARVGVQEGLVHVRHVDGVDSIPIILRVEPRPATLSVPTNMLTFTSQGETVTPPSRPLRVSSTGTSVNFEARPVTKAGGNWLRVNDGTTPVTLPTTTDLTITVAPGNLAAGNYTGSVELIQTSGTASTFSVPVQLTVTEALDLRPAISRDGIKDAAGGGTVISSAAWVSIYGSQLAPDTPNPDGRLWRADEIVSGKFPLALDGVSVTIGGKAAPIYFVSGTQLNVQAPDDLPLGNNVPVSVTTSKGSSQVAMANVQQVSPGLFVYGATRHVAAQHADYSGVGPPGLLPGATFTPARPGEVIIIYGTGFGATDPPTKAGETVAGGPRIAAPVRVRIAGVEAGTEGYLSGAGLYQLNVTVPESLPDGDHSVEAEIAGLRTQGNVLVRVARP